MPPIATPPCFRHTATSRRKMFDRKSVVLMSTLKRSGHTMSGSAITYSRMLAFRSQRAAFSPAAYGPSWCRISSIWKTAGSDSMSGMARMVARPQVLQPELALREEVPPEGRLPRRLDLGQVEVDAEPVLRLRAPRVEEREARAEDGRRHRLPLDRDLRLVEVQPPLPVHEEGQRPLLHGVVAAAGLVVVRQPARRPPACDSAPRAPCRPAGAPPSPRRRPGRPPRVRRRRRG